MGDSSQAAATPTEVPPIPTPDAYRKDLENTFGCRTDDDCVAIRNGCGVRKIVGNTRDIHDRFRCKCKQGRVVRGCFRAEKGP